LFPLNPEKEKWAKIILFRLALLHMPTSNCLSNQVTGISGTVPQTRHKTHKSVCSKSFHFEILFIIRNITAHGFMVPDLLLWLKKNKGIFGIIIGYRIYRIGQGVKKWRFGWGRRKIFNEMLP